MNPSESPCRPSAREKRDPCRTPRLQEPVTVEAHCIGPLLLSGSEDPIVIVSYDPKWSEQFLQLAASLRRAFGDIAVRFDHVGSTAVPGLAAKDVIDVQISVVDLSAEIGFRTPLETIGYRFQATNPDRTKRMFREPAGRRRTHVHAHGRFDDRLNLLFRDFLRAEPAAAEVYAAEKRTLAERFRDDRVGYVAAKEPALWSLLVQAHSWSQDVGWSLPPTDA